MVRNLLDYKITVNVVISTIDTWTVSGVADIMFTPKDDLLVAFEFKEKTGVGFIIIYADGTKQTKKVSVRATND